MSILRRIESALRRTDEAAFIRADFSRFGGYAQVSRALQVIVAKGLLLRVGHGAYVKARPADNGEPVLVLSPDEIEAQIAIKRAVATRKERRRDAKIDKLLARFSRGLVDRHDVQDQTGLSFGEILERMKQSGLTLPVVRTYDRLNGKQRALYDEIFSPDGPDPECGAGFPF